LFLIRLISQHRDGARHHDARGRCAFTGTDATAYVTPKPVKKPFDVGKPVGNVFGDLAVVAGALLVAAAFVTETGEQGSGEEEGEAPSGAGLLLLAGLSMIPRRRRGMSLGPLSANPANIPRLAGNAPLLTGNGAGTPLLTDGGPLLKQILKTDAPHLNAELAARLATKEDGQDYAKRLDAMGLLSENGNAGRGAAGVIDASAISGGVARRANVSPNKPVTPTDDSKRTRVTANAGRSADDVSGTGTAESAESKWFKSDGTPKWPDNDGFVGTPKKITLQSGTKIDRYGDEFGKFAAPEGTPYGQRALPPNSENSPYNSYEVIKPFDVASGITSPWFDQPGGGTQYQLPMAINDLIKQGYIR
jgi:hypothetical protein